MKKLTQIITESNIPAEHQIKAIELYQYAKEEFKAEHGSCLDAPDYVQHWNAREEYALGKVEEYIEERCKTQGNN